MVSFRHRLLFNTAGSVAALPARFRPDATKKPKGLEWEYQVASANAGTAVRGKPGAIGPAWLRSPLGRAGNGQGLGLNKNDSLNV
jgi:hypothetical protein